ncbi:MAG: hypothetical protein ABSF61_01045 [Anaerolineales bacterium]|jgi:hypothetical protein
MLTLFAVPKAFVGEFSGIQQNALRSWRALGEDVRILLIGNEQGVADEASRIRATNIPEVKRNEWGTPLVDDVFRIGSERADGEWLAYVNADILLLRDFLHAVHTLQGFRRPSLAVGQRWDLDLGKTIDFSDPRWEADTRAEVESMGRLHPPSGIDYFLFRRGTWKEIPPFALGRTMWDNWLVYSARARGLAVVDATDSVLAVHQNHSYGVRPAAADWVWKGPEAERNLELAGGLDHYFTIEDSTHRLKGTRVQLALDREHLLRRWSRLRILWPPAATLQSFFQRAWQAIYETRVRVARWRGRI